MTAAAAQLGDTMGGRTRPALRRLAVTWILLLAFSLQTYIAQTHFHAPPAAPSRAAADQPAKLVGHPPAPAGQDAIGCPLCQVAAAAGAFLAPAVSSPQPARALAALAARSPIVVGLAPAPAGFAWRSRAPPQG